MLGEGDPGTGSLPVHEPLPTIPQISWLPPVTHLVEPERRAPQHPAVQCSWKVATLPSVSPYVSSTCRGPGAPHKALPGVRPQPTSHHQSDLMSTFCLVLRQVRAAGAYPDASQLPAGALFPALRRPFTALLPQVP